MILFRKKVLVVLIRLRIILDLGVFVNVVFCLVWRFLFGCSVIFVVCFFLELDIRVVWGR